MANVIGPDVSFYQDDPETPQGIDFVKMKASAGYVIIRAGQNLWVDSDFKINWREAKLAGLPRGSYWFYDSRAEPKRQAELWAQQFNGDFGELPLFADFEESYNGTYKGWRNWYTFLERLKELVNGHEIAIYTAYYYWRDNAPMANPANLEYFHQYPLWIANYGVNTPLVPKPWAPTEWTFWQFTETGDGKLYGVESNGIDLNYFNGDLAAFKTRFKLSDAPPPPPDPNPDPNPDPGTPTGRKYRVTATALKVREGPGLTYNSLGLLYQNEVVEEIGATADRAWLRVRRLDGTTTTGSTGSTGTSSLTGWSYSYYLQEITTPPPPPPPPPDDEPSTPAPDDAARNWYRVTLSSLPVRESPTPGAKQIGSFLVDDTLPALDDTTHNDWAQLRRLDGLTGWCEKKYLALLASARPASTRQTLFKGVTYIRKDLTVPRKLITHILAIDLKAGGLEFLVTPSNDPNGILCSRTTSKFLKDFGVHVAVNADGFSYLDVNVYNPATYCSSGGVPLVVNGYAASRGKIYSKKKTAQPVIHITQSNQVRVNEEKLNKPFNVFSGDRIVVSGGKTVKNLAAATPSPRTALGVNRNGRWMILMVVDGRQPGYSEGVTFPELADLLLSYGVHTGVNLDGGGSSAMVIKGVDGLPRVLNSPIDENVPGKERAVANHLGIFIR